MFFAFLRGVALSFERSSFLEPLDPILVELEPSVRVNLREYLRRDLEREYQPKHRTKANKLGPQAIEELDLSGEHLIVMVRDQGKLQKVDMTFPLFDLDSDFTLIQCSCLRDALSLDPIRCHHMFLAQTVVAHRLDNILKQEKPDDALAQLQSYVQSDGDSLIQEEQLLLEQRWLLLWDPSTGGLSAERYTKPRYEKDASWHKEGRWSSSELVGALAAFQDPISQSLRTALLQGANRPDDELFEILRLVEGHHSIVLENRESRDPIEVRVGTWQLGIREEEEGYRLHIEVGPGRLPPWKLIPGRGLIAYDAAAQIIFLCGLDKRSEGLVSGVQQQKRLIPLQDRDAMLDFIEKLDPGIAVLWSDRPLERVAVENPQPMLRLSPFQRGGMKVEVWIQLSPGTAVRAGEGAEELRERSRRGALRQFIRDFQAERQLARRLENLLDLNILPEPENSIFIAYNDEVALALMARIEEHKKDLELLIEWPAALAGKEKPYAVSALVKDQSLRVSAGEKRDWFSVEGWLEMDDGQKIALRELLAACRQNKRYLRLSDGKWAAITEQFRQKMEPLVQSLDEDEEGCSFNLAALESDEQLAAIEKLDFTEVSQGFWKLVQKAKRSREADASLPTGLKADLRSYQKDGFLWMNHLAAAGLGACLADDMGLGKTLQSLAILLKYKDRGPSLVIAPSSLAYNWKAEAARFCPDLKIVILRELGDRGRSRTFAAGEIVIASYGLVMRYSEHLAQTSWNILVLDEAQQVKNAQTKTAKAVQELPAAWRLALSGTPIENHLGELWSLFRTISPGLFGEWERFRRSFAFPIERDQSQTARERLKRKIQPFVLRRLKQDHLAELPPKTEIDLWVDMSDDEQSFYDALRGEAIDKVETLAADDEALQKQKIQVLAALTRLRQAACHRTLVDPEWQGGATKIEILTERLLELKEAGHAALVFSQFTGFLRLIEDQLLSVGIRVLYLDGQTPVAQRQELVNTFQAGEGDVFLISLKAGGTGLNLTRASYVFHMDPWWNPAVEAQASDRAWRMGQKQAVTVYKMRARGTIEELIHTLHGEKKELVDSLLEGRTPNARFNWDEVWRLFTEPSRPLPGGIIAPREGRSEA
jgi:superfamily II DNA or RNA helicase